MSARHWDAIVIGTGVGGGTIGRRLAEQGLSVLFVEKGPNGSRESIDGLDAVTGTDPEERLRHGAWPDPVRARINDRDTSFYAAIGAGVGGSSVFYAATLERPEPHDLDDSISHPHPTKGWPVSFKQMLPYFDAAQALYHVHGQPDPLSQYPSPRLEEAQAPTPQDLRIIEQMRSAGLNPYQLHSAVREVNGCQHCLGRKCPKPCKMDGRSAGVEPALATGNAFLLDECEVTQICGNETRVSHLIARRHGEELRLTADHIILAAGALSSPRLMLESRNPSWPHGLGNSHDQVGRNLMFHFNEIFALWPNGPSGPEAVKSVGFRDLYFDGGQRMGMVQSMGLRAGKGEILYFMRQWLARSGLRNLPGARHLARIPAILAAKILGSAHVYVGLLEDLPYAQNRVRTDPQKAGGILIEYRFTEELLARRMHFRKQIRRRLKGLRTLFLTMDPEPNFGHPCGSLRMGNDPRSSVIDQDCRVHGIENLWVADASFMPTSMGVNPSLTIAANALRVGDIIAKIR